VKQGPRQLIPSWVRYLRRPSWLPFQLAREHPVQLSPTSILTLDQCPYQYELTYIRRLRDQYATAKPYFTMANHVHAVLRDFFRIVPVEARTVETIEQMLRERWRQYRGGFRTIDDERRWGEKALAQLRAFVKTENITAVDDLLGDLSASYADTLDPGACESHDFTRTILATDPNPL